MKTIESLLLEKGLKVWTKGENKRIYINDLNVVGIEKVSNNPKGYRKVSLVYDIVKDSFSWSGSTNSMDATIEELIALIRSEVEEANKEEVAVVEETKTTEEKVIEAYEAATKFDNEPKEVSFKLEINEDEIGELMKIKQIVWWELDESGLCEITYNPEA